MFIKFIFIGLEMAISSSNKRQMLIVKQKHATTIDYFKVFLD